MAKFATRFHLVEDGNRRSGPTSPMKIEASGRDRRVAARTNPDNDGRTGHSAAFFLPTGNGTLTGSR
ncbi:MAG TPA: hypothetical protein VNO30_17900 [Kofleriaceae bacterium]|nr:hypothetical protein [Kofleriaceae bacterium]